MTLGIGPGDEVICPSFTFFATAGCVARLGAVPVFVDVCPDCFNLVPAQVKSRLSPRTKAIIPVHLFGQSAEMDEITTLARENSLWVIEDAAQSIGAEFHGRKSGVIGDFGAFSFYPTKNLGALGDAGLLVTRNPDHAARARILRNHGMDPKYHYRWIGANFRMDALQAGFLRLKLSKLEDYNRRRAGNAAFYQRRLSEIPGVVQARKLCCQASSRSSDAGGSSPAPKLVLPVETAGRRHVWNQFTLRLPGAGRRDRLKEFLHTRHIGSEIYYPVPLHAQECFRSLSPPRDQFPNSDMLSREVLSIPVHPELTRDELEEVAAAIRDGIDLF
jgi:dTDP-4-amino-4,6-dideoxygalactose transaminase